MESLMQTAVVAVVLSGAVGYLLRRAVLALRPARGGGAGCMGGCGCSK